MSIVEGEESSGGACSWRELGIGSWRWDVSRRRRGFGSPHSDWVDVSAHVVVNVWSDFLVSDVRFVGERPSALRTVWLVGLVRSCVREDIHIVVSEGMGVFFHLWLSNIPSVSLSLRQGAPSALGTVWQERLGRSYIWESIHLIIGEMVRILFHFWLGDVLPLLLGMPRWEVAHVILGGLVHPWVVVCAADWIGLSHLLSSKLHGFSLEVAVAIWSYDLTWVAW